MIWTWNHALLVLSTDSLQKLHPLLTSCVISSPTFLKKTTIVKICRIYKTIRHNQNRKDICCNHLHEIEQKYIKRLSAFHALYRLVYENIVLLAYAVHSKAVLLLLMILCLLLLPCFEGVWSLFFDIVITCSVVLSSFCNPFAEKERELFAWL